MPTLNASTDNFKYSIICIHNFPFMFSTHGSVCFSLLVYPCCMAHSSHWFSFNYKSHYILVPPITLLCPITLLSTSTDNYFNHFNKFTLHRQRLKKKNSKWKLSLGPNTRYQNSYNSSIRYGTDLPILRFMQCFKDIQLILTISYYLQFL